MRPKLDCNLESEEFKKYYYLKEELLAFCRAEGLAVGGKKENINERIVHCLDTKEKIAYKRQIKGSGNGTELTLDTKIGSPITFSEKKRAFFEQYLGNGFRFKVVFQRWLKEYSDKTYREAIEIYPKLIAKKTKTIDKQFEYNTYIRDFFEDNVGKTLKEAIVCWNYKKGIAGHNRYEKEDLEALK